MKNYRELLRKEYIFVYFIYFFVFFAIGSLDQQIPLYFADKENGPLVYGFFLSSLSVASVIMPTISAMLAKKYGSKKVTVIYFLTSVILAALLFLISNVYIIVVIFLLINISQYVFNFSLGSLICFSVNNKAKARFFAVRDIFLYGSIALGLMISGILVNKYDVKYIISIFGMFLIIPCIMLFFGKNNQFVAGIMEEDDDERAGFRGIKKAFKNREFVIMLMIYSFLTIYSAIYAYVPFLAIEVGLNYSEVLNSFAIVTIVNVFIGLFLSHLADSTNKKIFFIIDVGFDLIPIFIFIFTTNYYMFIVALVLSALKDVFAPITFAYKYELFTKDGQLLISLLESITGIFTFILPVVIGFLWKQIGKNVFIIAFLAVFLATILAFLLPKEVED
jgi:MFS family permease